MSTLEFNQKVMSFKTPLNYFAISLTQNAEEAKDLLQDTFYKAILYKDKFTDATNLKAWLYTIMKNTFINNYRRRVKRNTFLDSTDNDYYLNSPSHADTNGGEKKMAMDDIQAAIGKLPFELKEDKKVLLESNNALHKNSIRKL